MRSAIKKTIAVLFLSTIGSARAEQFTCSFNCYGDSERKSCIAKYVRTGDREFTDNNEKYRAEENSRFVGFSNMKLGDESSTTTSAIINRSTLKFAGFATTMTLGRTGTLHIQQFTSEGVCTREEN